MSDNKFENPYLKGTRPKDDMDYVDILNEYREKNNIDIQLPYKKKGMMELDRSALLDPLDGVEEGEHKNRFEFDLKRDVLGEVDVNELRSMSRVSYSDSYRPRKDAINTSRNYSDLAKIGDADSADVRRVIGERRRKAVSHHPSPVSAPRETIEEKRARIANLLPTPQEQRELDRLARKQKTIYATPSFMQDELVFEELSINDTDVVTSLRTNVDLPGFIYRERYMHQGLDEYSQESIPKTVRPIGFGGDGGDIPEFESESSNWSNRPDAERFAPPSETDNYGVIPMEQLNDKRSIRRAKVRVGDKKIAAAYKSGAGATAVFDEERQKRALELAAKKRRIERRVNRAKGEEDVQLPNAFTDLDSIQRQAVEDARSAGMESGREFAGNISSTSTGRIFMEYKDDGSFESAEARASNNDLSSLAPKQNTFTDGNFERNRSGQGIINPKKSAYSYLFDDSEEVPENITDIEKNNALGGGKSDYSYLFMTDEDIDNQIKAAEQKKKKKAVYTEPIGLSENKESLGSLNSAVKNKVELTSDEVVSNEENLPTKFESASHMTLKKGNISFKSLGGVSSVRKKGRVVETAISEKYIPENPNAVDMPQAVKYAEGFSAVSPEINNKSDNIPVQSSGVAFKEENEYPQQAFGFSNDEQNISFSEQEVKDKPTDNIISFEDALAYSNKMRDSSTDEEADIFDTKREQLYTKVQNVIFSIGSTAIALLILFVLELLPQFGVNMPDALNPQTAPAVYYILNLIMAVMCTVFCRDIIFLGFKDIFSGKPSYKSFCSIATMSVIAHTVAAFVQTLMDGTAQRVYVTAFLLALTVMEAGKLFKTMRIGKGLTFISADRKRGALMVAGVQDGANSINAACNFNDGSVITYHTDTKELSDYFQYAEEEDLSEKTSAKTFYWILVGCLLCSVIGGIATKSIYGFFTALSLCSVISMPFTAEISNNLPLSRLSKKLLRRGAMISGWSAVNEFSDTNTVILDSEEIFPKETVELMGIKTFGDKRIDRAILDAAALTISIGGTLGTVFSKLVAGNIDILPEVDSPMYEEGFGMSGWAKGRRIIFGNKAMLELYGVETPVRDYEVMYAEEGSKVVYLSSNGELSAMFILKYHTDERVRENLYNLAESGITIAIRSSDINITPELVSRTFNIHPSWVRILPWSLSPVVDMLTSEERESTPAVAATNRSLSAMATVLSAIRRIKSQLVVSVVLQTVASFIGLAFGLFLSITGACGDFNPVQTVLYCLFWVLVIAIVPNIKKVIK